VGFLFNLGVPEGKAGHIDDSTLGLAIIERLDFIAERLQYLGTKEGTSAQLQTHETDQPHSHSQVQLRCDTNGVDSELHPQEG
jgi:hypothetical protein